LTETVSTKSQQTLEITFFWYRVSREYKKTMRKLTTTSRNPEFNF
jgi:hypothetical protein